MMEKNRQKGYKRGALLMLLVLAASLCGHAQADAGQPKEQAVSQTGLLPVYGVDFNFDPAWVDGASFPSQSAEHPNAGVNATFQQVWEALKPSGFNIMRVPLDVRDQPGALATQRQVQIAPGKELRLALSATVPETAATGAVQVYRVVERVNGQITGGVTLVVEAR